MITADLRGRLIAERHELLGDIAREDGVLSTPLEDKGEDTTPSQHPADVASDLYAREASLIFERAQREDLAEIDGALRRLRNGTFGLCTDCGGPIAVERLEVLPQAARCIDCQRHWERGR